MCSIIQFYIVKHAVEAFAVLRTHRRRLKLLPSVGASLSVLSEVVFLYVGDNYRSE